MSLDSFYSSILKDLFANTEGSGKTPRREQRDLGILNFRMKVCSELYRIGRYRTKQKCLSRLLIPLMKKQLVTN